MIRGVVFDVGEVLVDETRWWGAWADRLGVPRHTFSAVFGAVIADGRDHRETFSLLVPGFDPEEQQAAGRPARLGDDDLYPDARPALAALRGAGLWIGVAGNQPAASGDALRALDLPVDLVLTSAELGAEKPDPAFFAAIERRAPWPAAELLYVGDRLDNDVRPPAGRGFRTALLRRGPWAVIQQHDPDVGRVPTLRIDGLDELPGRIAAFNAGPGRGSRRPERRRRPDTVGMRLHPGEVEATGWRVEKPADVLRRLRAASPGVAGRPRLIAVDGRGGAGKSTLVERLRAIVPASGVVHTDDVAWNHAFFDWGDVLVENVLRPLHRGAAVEFRPPAWIEHDRPGAIRVPSGLDVVWLEGTGVVRGELAPWIDASIWVQGDLDEQERRLVARDGDSADQQRHVAAWLAEELPLLLRERPWQKATVVVAGTPRLDHDPDTEIVVAPPTAP